MTTQKQNPDKIVTGVVRYSFMSGTTREEDAGGNINSGSMFIIPKINKRTIANAKKAIEDKSNKKYGKRVGNKTRNV